MKPGLAVLPMDVWADVFVHPWITRQQLSRIVHRFKERAFAEKLQKFLHDPKCGKHSLRYLDIFSKQPDKITQKLEIHECRALLAVAPDGKQFPREECEFPETEMPVNVISFKQLFIGHFDAQVLDFLDKIKPLFNNVFLVIYPMQPEDTLFLLSHLLPMLGSIRGIRCDKDGMELLEDKFPGTLARAEELHLPAEPAFIPTYLNWLSAPLDFNLHGPRFLWSVASPKTMFAIVDAVRKQFLTATTQSAFAIFLEFYQSERHLRTDEFNIENPATKEQLSIRNAIFKKPNGDDIHYVEVLRHPMDADAKMQEWIEKRAFYKKNKFDSHGEANKVIWIDDLTIGHITEKADAIDQDNGQSTDADKNEAGPSTSSARIDGNGMCGYGHNVRKFHDGRDTRHGGGRGGRSIKCYNCGCYGHYARECQEEQRDNRRAGCNDHGDMKCYGCGKSGHFLRDCPEGEGGGSGPRRGDNRSCYNCSKYGHLSRDCPEQRR